MQLRRVKTQHISQKSSVFSADPGGKGCGSLKSSAGRNNRLKNQGFLKKIQIGKKRDFR